MNKIWKINNFGVVFNIFEIKKIKVKDQYIKIIKLKRKDFLSMKNHLEEDQYLKIYLNIIFKHNIFKYNFNEKIKKKEIKKEQH